MDVYREKTDSPKMNKREAVNLLNAAYKPNLPEGMKDEILRQGNVKGFRSYHARQVEMGVGQGRRSFC